MFFLEKLIPDFILPKQMYVNPFEKYGSETIILDYDKNAIKVYSNLLKNDLEVGYQPNGMPKDTFKDLKNKRLNIKPLGSLYPKDFK